MYVFIEVRETLKRLDPFDGCEASSLSRGGLKPASSLPPIK